MHKEIRKQMILRRKNFLPSLVITLLLFTSLVLTIYFLDPASSLNILIFFILIFTLSFFIFSLILANSKRGLIISFCITLFIILRYFGIGNILNAVLIAGIGIIAIIHNERTAKRNKKHIFSNS